MPPDTSIHRSPSQISLHDLDSDNTTVRPSGSGTHTAPAQALASGSGPVSPRRLSAIERHNSDAISVVHDDEPAEIALEWQGEPPAALAVQRQALLNMRDNAEVPQLAKLIEQFHLEGLAVREALNRPQDIADLLSGHTTREAVAGNLPDTHAGLLSRSNLYVVANTGSSEAVTEPFSNQQLAAANITGTPAELRTQRLCLTHEAYQAAIKQLQAVEHRSPEQDAALENVQLAHQAFKVGIAAAQSMLEVDQVNMVVRHEMAANKLLLVTNKTDREEKVNFLKPQLDAINEVLADHAKVSNYVLAEENKADHKRRAITSGDGIGSTAHKTAKQAAIATSQLAASWITWGYGRNGGTALAKYIVGDATGAWTDVVSVMLQALALGVSHKLISDGPKDGFQAIAELGGWARPPEASNVNQLFPDARSSALNEDGEPVARDAAEVHTEQQAIIATRKKFKAESPVYTFGNANGNNVGELAFAFVNTIRDGLESHGVAGAGTIHGRAGTSAGGGELMTTVQNVGQLSTEVMGLPAYVAAKRPNPRSVWQRTLTGAQKGDLTESANRLDGYSKIAHASLGMAGAQVLGKIGSEPLRDKQLAADGTGQKAGWATLHALLEGGKSIPTLGFFFPTLTVAAEAKALPGEMSAWKKRLLTGPTTLVDANADSRTAAKPQHKGGYYRQVADKMMTGTAQTLAQPIAVGAERSVAGGTNLVLQGGSALRRLATGKRREEGPGDAQV